MSLCATDLHCLGDSWASCMSLLWWWLLFVACLILFPVQVQSWPRMVSMLLALIDALWYNVASVVCNICIVAKWCIPISQSKSLGRLWEVVCEESISTRGRLRSCQPLCHICHWVSQKPLEVEAWFQRTSNRKWPMGNGYMTDDITWPRKVNLWPQYAWSSISRK